MRHVSISAEDELAIVTIDRPPANALSPDLLAEGLEAARELARRAPAAAVIQGRPGYFSAGLDLKIAPTLDEEGRRALARGINDLFLAWYGFPRPVVCAVGGHAIAGGLILALCGDWRVVGRSGRFGLTELRAGVPYPAAASAIVRAELGAESARRLMLRADLMDAGAALRAGVFDEQVDDGAVLARAKSVAEELAGLPAAAFARTKRDLRGQTIAEVGRVLESETETSPTEWLAEDAGERAARLLGDG